MCDVLRIVWWLVESLLMWFHACVVVNCAMLWKWSSSHYLCEHVIALFWGMIVEVLCALRKNDNLKRMYHFERRIARRDGYYISRDVSCAAMVTVIEGRVVRRDRYVPHGFQTERQRVCITRTDMHHYTWHCITLRCTYLSLVNLILCFADLVVAFLWNL